MIKLPLRPLSILYYEFFNKEIKTPLLIFRKTLFYKIEYCNSSIIPKNPPQKMDLIGKKAFYTQQSRVPPYFVPLVSLF